MTCNAETRRKPPLLQVLQVLQESNKQNWIDGVRYGPNHSNDGSLLVAMARQSVDGDL